MTGCRLDFSLSESSKTYWFISLAVALWGLWLARNEKSIFSVVGTSTLDDASCAVLIEAKRVGKAALSVESHSQGVRSWLDSSPSNLCNGGRFSRT
ncbi:hypothetical protein V6N13_016766 [Hibiscus sabdariffa]